MKETYEKLDRWCQKHDRLLCEGFATAVIAEFVIILLIMVAKREMWSFQFLYLFPLRH